MAATAQPQHSAVRQTRPSIVIDSDCNAMDYPGSDVLIHKKDFLIHIKKLSVRSQSSDCASDCRKTDLSSKRIVLLIISKNLLLFQLFFQTFLTESSYDIC